LGLAGMGKKEQIGLAIFILNVNLLMAEIIHSK
jgi:hypothetical protein